VQAYVEEEREPVADLLEQFRRDLPANRVEAFLHLREPRHQVPDGRGADLRQSLSADAHSPGLGVQSFAGARRAGHDAHVLLKLQPSRAGRGLLEAGQQLRNDSLPRPAVLPHAAESLLPLEGDVPVAGAVEEPVAMLLRQVLPWRGQIDPEGLPDAFEDVLAPLAHAAKPADDRDGPFVERDRRVGNEQVRVEGVTAAEPVAVRTHPLGAVEAKELRRRGLVADVAVGAGVVGREKDVLGFHTGFRFFGRCFGRSLDGNNQRPVRERECLLDGLGESRADAGLVLQSVDDNRDVVLDPLVESEVVGEAHDPAIDAGADVAALEHVREEVLEFALLPANDRGENEEAGLRRQRKNPVDDLFAGLGGDRPPAVGTVALTDPSVENAQEVRDLGHGADGRSRVAARGLLLNADGRRQPADVVHVRLGQLAEELSGVTGKRFHVPPLAFGVECVKRQRRLARSADAGEDDQRVSGQSQVNVPEVVLARAPDDDLLLLHRAVRTRGCGRVV